MYLYCNTLPFLIVFQKRIMVTKLSMKSSFVKTCHKNLRHKAKLVSILSNFLLQERKLSLSAFCILGTGLFSQEISCIISVMFKIRIERNKAGKGIIIQCNVYYLVQNFREIMIIVSIGASTPPPPILPKRHLFFAPFPLYIYIYIFCEIPCLKIGSFSEPP